MKTPLLISAGAVLGALCRYYLGLYFAKLFPTVFPVGTFIVNLSGCFLMGLFMGRLLNFHPETTLFFAVGFLGSYTTFSTFGADSVNLLRNGNYLLFAIYLICSCLCGVTLTGLGLFLSRWFK